MQSVVADVQWSVCSLLTAMSGAKTIERRLVTDTDTIIAGTRASIASRAVKIAHV